MNNFEIIIGLENHVQLKTKTKIFSQSLIQFGAQPNTLVNSLDVGYPGIMPSLNKKAVELALKACKAFHLSINDVLSFDRKNYYYSDLSKGFQITQQFNPIGREGYLIVKNKEQEDFKVSIERMHLEEDTAKQIHDQEATLLDYNRSGIGLIEIVTKPVIRSCEVAVNYVKKIQQILSLWDISSAKMNEGSLRCDVNISLRPFGYPKLLNKVEIKNLNSFANIRKAILFEIKRQTTILNLGGIVEQTTRRFDESTNTTVLMRKKDNNIDYRFFNEPNIQPVRLNNSWIQNILNTTPPRPEEVKFDLIHKYKLNKQVVINLMNNYDLLNYFLQIMKQTKNNLSIISNALIGDIAGYLNIKNKSIKDTYLNANKLIKLSILLAKEKISSKHFKLILKYLLENETSIENSIKVLNIVYIIDSKLIKKLIIEITQENDNFIKKNIDRPEKIQKFIMGKLMQKTQGNVSPKIAQNQILQIISKFNI